MDTRQAMLHAQRGEMEKVYGSIAIQHDMRSDREMWISALGCSRVVARDGHGDRGKTLGLADEMSRSVDTVENRAHAYWLFEDLCRVDNGAHRQFVFMVRRLPYVKLNHFATLYDARSAYSLSDGDILSLLLDLYHSEGLSTRKLQQSLSDKYGPVREWTYYGQRAMKEIHKTLQHPETPRDVREVLSDAYSKLGDQA